MIYFGKMVVLMVFPIATSMWNYQKDLEGTTCPWGYHRTHWVQSPFHPHSHLLNPTSRMHFFLKVSISDSNSFSSCAWHSERIIKCLVVMDMDMNPYESWRILWISKNYMEVSWKGGTPNHPKLALKPMFLGSPHVKQSSQCCVTGP